MGGRVRWPQRWYDRSEDRWEQVFVTDHALDVGATKQKAEVTALTTSTRIRFHGRYPGRMDGTLIDDRTTLTLGEPGRIRQHIEMSTDGGAAWETVFDAEYRRAD